METLRLAWRNLRRNRRRTAVTLAALAVNTAVLTFAFALRAGIVAGMERDATRLTTGDAQAHASGYRHRRSIHAAIPDPGALLAAVRARGIRAAPRAFGQALVSCGPRSVGARIWGVDPEAERASFDLAGRISSGSFLAGAPGRRVVLGRRLARSLLAEVGGEVVVVAQAADGSLGNEIFVVAGILGPADDEVDRRAAIIHEADFGELFVAPGRVHEIALSAGGRLSAAQVAGIVSALRPDLEVLAWRQLLPHLASLVDFWKATIWLFAVVFALAAGIAVANTMFMTTYERTREFGLQKALGATPGRIVRDVAVEALLLTVLAAVVGAAAGTAAAAWARAVGIDVGSRFAGSISLSGLAIEPVLRPVLSLRMIVQPVALLGVVSVLASLYPAIRAARTDPARTMAQV